MNEVLAAVDKSANDQREYRCIKLPNGLVVLLVSDPQSEKAAASMDVNVGSFHESGTVAGLAHFLEHMLFLGTAKFPNENEYNTFLSEHGGCSNAYTAGENTNFYFDVLAPHLEGALDRFAQFFVSPSFTESATQRELDIIESEHSNNKQSDAWQTNQLLRNIANKQHPFSRFSTGNLQTLRDWPKERGEDVRTLMIEFFRTHYHASNMALAVLGTETLDELEATVSSLFSAVRSEPTPAPPPPPMAPFPPSPSPLLLRSVPVKNSRTLTLFFPCDAPEVDYEHKPLHVISHLIGHEGEGSLLSLLKAQGVATSLVAGPYPISSLHCLLQVRVGLTEHGAKEWEGVAEAMFEYIALLRKAVDEESAQLLECAREVKLVDEIGFRFLEVREPRAAVTFLAKALHQYPPARVFTGAHLILAPEPSLPLLAKVLSQMVVANAVVHLRIAGLETDQVDEFYEAKYGVSPLPEALVERLGGVGLNPKLRLPDTNEFIPTQFDLLPSSSCDEPMLPPTLYTPSQALSLYHKSDVSFSVPKAVVILELSSPLAYLSPRTTVLTSLMTKLVSDSLVEFAYQAETAGLQFSVSNLQRGITVTVSGYTHKLSILLARIVERVWDIRFDPERFRLLKEQQQLEYDSFNRNPGSSLAMYELTQLIQTPKWHAQAYKAELPSVSLEELQGHHDALVRKLCVEGLVHGNVDKAYLDDIAALLSNTLHLKPVPKDELVALRAVVVPSGEEWSVLHHTYENPDEKNNVVVLLLQVGPENTKEDVLIDLLHQIIDQAAFHTLRTTEGLGYVVGSQVHRTHCVQGLLLYVVSSTHSCEHIHARICTFLKHFENKLKTMEKAEWDRYVAALKSLKLQKPKTLARKAQRWWGEIHTRARQFDRVEREVKVLDAIQQQDLQEFYAKYISTGPGSAEAKRRVAVFAHPQQQSNEGVKEVKEEAKEEKAVVAKEEAEAKEEGEEVVAKEEAEAEEEKAKEDVAKEEGKKEKGEGEGDDPVPALVRVIKDVAAFKNSALLYPAV